MSAGDKTASVRWAGHGLRFNALTGSGHRLALDDAGGDAGPRPIELLLVAQAGCTAMDVASILGKKRQVVTHYEVLVSGMQREAHPQVFRHIDVLHDLEGPSLDVEAVRRAIELSATRYCTVGAMLAAGVAEVAHRYRVLSGNGDQVQELTGEVVVRGPHADPEEDPSAGPSGRSSAGRRALAATP